jgi:hypothetical protein
VSYTRRGLLFGGFGALVAAILYKWQQPDPIDVLWKRLRALFPELVAATPILKGISELALLSGDRTALAFSIFSQERVIAANSTEQETMDFIALAVDRDFEDSRFVMIKGWTLSQTEERLLAFIAAGGT